MLQSSIAYIFCSFLSLILLWPLVPSHWRARNSGITLIIFWTSLGNIVQAASAISLLNATNVVNPEWCDFAGTIRYMWGIGACSGNLLLLRRLAIIASPHSKPIDPTRKSKIFISELAIGVIIPVLQIPLHLTVQGHRINEIINFGCLAPIYPSVLSIILVLCYMLLINLICAMYGSIAVYHLFKRREEMNSLLNMKTPGTSTIQFLKLTALGVFQSSLWLPLSLAFTIVNVVKSGVLPYQGWNIVHMHFNTVKLIDPRMIPSEELVLLELSRWMGPVTAVCLFLFFGTKKHMWTRLKDSCMYAIDRISGRVNIHQGEHVHNNQLFAQESDETTDDNTVKRIDDLESQEIGYETIVGMPADCKETTVSMSTISMSPESIDQDSFKDKII
ncbi:hypothetical protein MNAN1_000322b [Malassezia nana]|uniref:Uncharacterized protein n=1 Tax=Malassezia nana TaxID=180528 RepID=A0AAF0J0T8_9BASI|nr:hypothetical protein MNAN1_000322b [Malassezia nana]